MFVVFLIKAAVRDVFRYFGNPVSKFHLTYHRELINE
jgi:hypothetical protein